MEDICVWMGLSITKAKLCPNDAKQEDVAFILNYAHHFRVRTISLQPKPSFLHFFP